MKASALNPNAMSYVPLAKREVKEGNRECNTLPAEPAVPDSNPVVDDLKQKGQQIDVSQGGLSQNVHETENKFSDEETEMELAYLQMVFPGVSEQSLLDVYNVNRGDLDAAVDMLSELESVDNLPDAAACGESQEPVRSGDCSAKLLNVAGESSGSGASVVAVPT